MPTPRSIKIVIQLLMIVFLTAIAISSVNLSLSVRRHDKLEDFFLIIRNSYDRVAYTQMNRMINRILLNIANGYEENSNDLLEDRYQTY